MPTSIKWTDDFWMRSPYGAPGDRLWVLETLLVVVDGLEYATDGDLLDMDEIPGAWDLWNRRASEDGPDVATTVIPSRHMPRWACRLMLEITDVRVGRLQEISGHDAAYEGIDIPHLGYASNPHAETAYRLAFRNLWDGLNAERGYGWDVNPWVWVVTFRRIEGAHG